MESKHKVTQCLFVKHLPKGSDHKDTHFIVLKHVKEDDTFTKELKILENYQRPVWVTKPIHRKYKHKKEYEHEDRLDKIKTTQSDMPYAVCRALGKETSNYNIRNIKDSPYIYGMDVPSTAFIKEIYDIKSDNYFRAFDILNLDIEFDVTGKYNDVSIVTLSMPGLRHTFALRRLYKNIGNDEYVINKIKTMSLELLPDSEAKKICKVYNVTLYNNDLDLLKAVFKMVHELSPDIATFHNIVYDISRITERLEFWNVKPEDLFSDPSVPENQRYFIFKKAKTSKEKKGKKYSIPIEEQWTTVDFPAKFMLMDNMTTYDAIRQGGGKVVGGYGLDNLLKKNGVEGKLFYTDEFTENLTKLQWHIYMSENKPLEYTIYAEQDTLGMTNLELKTKDFSYSVPVFIGIGDFNRFNSSVHKNVCTGYLDHKERNLIIGTTPTNPTDWSILGTNDWIKTLGSDNIQEIGLEVTNIPGLKTNVTAHADDVDCVSSYPSDTEACNVSSTTCVAEVISVGNFDKTEFKNHNINLVSSNANNTEYMTDMLKAPTIIQMIEMSRYEINTL